MIENENGPAWPEDDELIRRIGAADERALESLMERYSSRVMSTALRVLRTHSEAEEVTQDVFLALWQHPGRFDAAKAPLVTWLMILTRSRALDLLRRIKSKIQSENRLQVRMLTTNAIQSFRPDRDLTLEEVLCRLPPQQESVIRRAYFHGYALCEIAAEQHLPLGTVKGRARFAIKRMRSELAPLRYIRNSVESRVFGP